MWGDETREMEGAAQLSTGLGPIEALEWSRCLAETSADGGFGDVFLTWAQEFNLGTLGLVTWALGIPLTARLVGTGSLWHRFSSVVHPLWPGCPGQCLTHEQERQWEVRMVGRALPLAGWVGGWQPHRGKPGSRGWELGY